MMGRMRLRVSRHAGLHFLHRELLSSNRRGGRVHRSAASAVPPSAGRAGQGVAWCVAARGAVLFGKPL
ncbi:glycosyl transferase, group 1 family domain protein [Burkholderia mallei]|nr:glycosyl transferase, group 1 family domain protein [Burkholderia mallei]